jgi:hypothetical protein
MLAKVFKNSFSLASRHVRMTQLCTVGVRSFGLTKYKFDDEDF